MLCNVKIILKYSYQEGMVSPALKLQNYYMTVVDSGCGPGFTTILMYEISV